MSNKNPNGIFLPRISFLFLYMLMMRLLCELIVYPRSVDMAEQKFFAPHEQAKNIARMLTELMWAGGFVALALGSCVFYKLGRHFSSGKAAGSETEALLPSQQSGGRWTYYNPRAASLIALALTQLLAALSLYTIDNMVRFVADGDLDFKARVAVNVTATVLAVAQIFNFLNMMRPFSVQALPDTVERTGFFADLKRVDRFLQKRLWTVPMEHTSVHI